MLIELFVLTLAVATPAEEAQAADAPAAERPLQPGERKIKVICRNETKPNSRFVKRKCTEINAYERQSEIDRRAFEEVQNRPFTPPPCQLSGQSC